ncbi:alpha/beta hydrolase fold domain-containing protein [Kineococcus aurantiacus]|uniref:Acetyl esterase n=1 Tax=Kineococcus aurantiacus TaxID=37633 RepID=A0A7Y9DLQ7_9ACTN|nr:acetyl esterase [Kineococcus aurantiacus]
MDRAEHGTALAAAPTSPAPPGGHLPPRHLAGLAVARARARARHREPHDDDVLEVRDVVVRGAAGPLPARTYVPRRGHRGTVLFLHRGGWALGDVGSDDAVCRGLAAGAGTAVLSLGYRLAPEHPHPAALDDASAVLWALADGPVAGLRGPLAVAGVGAGAQLAAVLALRSRAAHTPRLRHQSLFCPLLDGRLDRESHRDFGAGPGLSVEDLAWFWRMYVPDRATRRRPDVSPLRAPDLVGSVPATVVVAGRDPLRDEGLAYVAGLRGAGVDCRCVLVEEAPHAFVSDPGLVAGAAAVRAAADHLRAALDPPRVVDLRDSVLLDRRPAGTAALRR